MLEDGSTIIIKNDESVLKIDEEINICFNSQNICANFN